METSQPKSILLATSDPENGRALLDLISPCGLAIVQASSVPEALASAGESGGHCFVIEVTDGWSSSTGASDRDAMATANTAVAKVWEEM